MRSLLPRDLTVLSGLRLVRVFAAVYMVVIVVRIWIHLFTPDGGAQSIAGIDTSVAGGDNIIAIFHQWGATQLLLVAVLIVLFFRYPGLTPLIVLTLAAEGIMRMMASHILPVTTQGTPPGAALNWPVFGFVVVLFLLSLIERRPMQKIAERLGSLPGDGCLHNCRHEE